MRRHWLFNWKWAVVLIAGIAAGMYVAFEAGRNTGETVGSLGLLSSPAHEVALEAMGKPYELVLARTYLCGVKDEERRPLSRDQLSQELNKYRGWEVVSADAAKLILHKRENDIAPSCKANGYFGLSKDGFLTLFNGLPSEQNVIQTFYQINTAKMEASLSKEEVESLRKGIRVRDLAEYNSVLSTYGEFLAE
jgi:forespore regulator of the sigma-K checkpoint